MSAAPKDPSKIIVCGEDCGGGGSLPPSVPVLSIGDIQIGPRFEVSHLATTAAYNIVLKNTGANGTNAHLDVYLLQGTTRAHVSSLPIQCGTQSGVFQTGSCQVFQTFSFASLAAQSLAPEIVDVEFDFSANGQTVSRRTAVTLIPGIVGDHSPLQLSLGGDSQFFGVSVENSGPSPVSGLSIQYQILQRSTIVTLGTASVQCPSGATGVLLAHSTCNASLIAGIDPTNPGTAGLVDGPATIKRTYLQGSAVLEVIGESVEIVGTR